MSELIALQREMMNWLVNKDDAIRQQVIATEKVSVDTRLNIYANSYQYRLLDALSDNFPALHTLLGDDDFYNAGSEYLAAYPSRHFSIRYFGSHLEDFLKQRYPKQPVLIEMAHFEWALRHAFDAEGSKTLTLSALQKVAPEQWGNLCFHLHPSITLLKFEWNTPQLWAAIEQESSPIPPKQSEQPVPYLVWRQELSTHYKSLSVDEAWALDRANRGHDFSDICEGLCEWIEPHDTPQRVAGFISGWVEKGLIVEIRDNFANGLKC